MVERVEKLLADHDRSHWLEMADQRGLPLSAVRTADEAAADPVFSDAGLIETLLLPGGETVQGVGPWMPDAGRTPDRPAPALGEHTEAVLAAFGPDSKEPR